MRFVEFLESVRDLVVVTLSLPVVGAYSFYVPIGEVCTRGEPLEECLRFSSKSRTCGVVFGLRLYTLRAT